MGNLNEYLNLSGSAKIFLYSVCGFVGKWNAYWQRSFENVNYRRFDQV